MATFHQPGIVANSEVPELLNTRAPKYDDEGKEEMVNPWVSYVEVGEACFDPYNKQSTRDLPYGRCGLPEDRFGAPSAYPTMINYGNHNGSSHE